MGLGLRGGGEQHSVSQPEGAQHQLQPRAPEAEATAPPPPSTSHPAHLQRAGAAAMTINVHCSVTRDVTTMTQP
jgi:hypothetical protein